MDPRDLKVTQTTYFSLLTHAKHLSLVKFCDTTAGIGATFHTYIYLYFSSPQQPKWSEGDPDYIYFTNTFQATFISDIVR